MIPAVAEQVLSDLRMWSTIDLQQVKFVKGYEVGELWKCSWKVVFPLLVIQMEQEWTISIIDSPNTEQRALTLKLGLFKLLEQRRHYNCQR